jgi:hypothetical protein
VALVLVLALVHPQLYPLLLQLLLLRQFQHRSAGSICRLFFHLFSNQRLQQQQPLLPRSTLPELG